MGLLSVEGFEEYFEPEDTTMAIENPHLFEVRIFGSHMKMMFSASSFPLLDCLRD